MWKRRLVLGTLQLAWRYRTFVACIILVSGLAGFLSARVRTPYFIARASIFPPPVEGALGGFGLAGMAGFVGGLGLGGGGGTLFPLYESFAYSRSVVSDLLNLRLDETGGTGTLLDHLRIEDTDPNRRLDTAIEAVRQRLTFETDKKTGVVTITYLDFDPKIAAYVVNHVVEALDRFDIEISAKRAGGKRAFIEQRVAESAKSLTEAENRLEEFRQENLRIGNSPELLFEQGRLQREVEIEQGIYLALRKEYELTRIEEERSVSVVNVLDRATPPVLPAGPSVAKFAIAAAFLSALLMAGILALVAIQPRRTVAELVATMRLQ
jgi:uncharacterized protein involved in exopolysaccharide biosynthesis